MKVIKATNAQVKTLNGIYKNGSVLQFALDGAGNNIVGLAILDNPDFEDIHEELAALPQIDYIKPNVDQ